MACMHWPPCNTCCCYCLSLVYILHFWHGDSLNRGKRPNAPYDSTPPASLVSLNMGPRYYFHALTYILEHLYDKNRYLILGNSHGNKFPRPGSCKSSCPDKSPAWDHSLRTIPTQVNSKFSGRERCLRGKCHG